MKAMEYQRRLGPAFGGAPGAIVHGGGQQAGRTVQTSSSSSESGPSPVLQEKLQNLVGNQWGWLAQHMNAPAYFPDSTVAPYSAQTQQAVNALFNRGQSGSPLQTAGTQNLLDTLGGNYLDIGSNPYFQKAIAAAN